MNGLGLLPVEGTRGSVRGSARGRLLNPLDGKAQLPVHYDQVLIWMNREEYCLQPLKGLSCGKGIKMYFMWLGRAKLEPMGGSFNRQISAQPKEGYSNN